MAEWLVNIAIKDLDSFWLPGTPSFACGFYPDSFGMVAGPLGIVNAFQVER